MANYIDNEKFYDELKKHRVKYLESKEKGEEPPQLSRYIGECLLSIATHYSYRSRFINYTYREELIGDAVEICVKYVNSFDPEKSKNPFSYFTTSCHREFHRTLKKERKQKDIKDALLTDVESVEYTTQPHDADEKYNNTFSDFMRENLDDEN